MTPRWRLLLIGPDFADGAPLEDVPEAERETAARVRSRIRALGWAPRIPLAEGIAAGYILNKWLLMLDDLLLSVAITFLMSVWRTALAH